MAAEAGPSGAGDMENFEELQDPPYPEPTQQPMALCDLLGLAAEPETAGRAQEGEWRHSRQQQQQHRLQLGWCRF